MPALDLIQFLTNALYVGIFVVTLARAIRQPRLANIEIALLFGTAAVVVAVSWVFAALNTRPPAIANNIAGALVLVLPYILLRLVDEFAGVPGAVLRLAEAALAVSVAALFVFTPPAPAAVTTFQVLYFVGLTLFITAAFVRVARTSIGSTAKRLWAVAIGSGLLALDIFVAGLSALAPQLSGQAQIAAALAGAASGVAYYVGFATPGWLARSWREPALITFLDRADEVAEQPDIPSILRELQAGVSAALGLPDSFVAIWHEQDNMLESLPSQKLSIAQIEAAASGIRVGAELVRTPPDATLVGRCFSSQQPVYSEDVIKDDPERAAVYRLIGARAMLLAPISLGEERFGVLGVYSPRPTLFADDSLSRLQLMAHYAAVMLRSRTLLERNAAALAERQLAHLREDFISAATHDLKTPLTAIKGISQFRSKRILSGDPLEPTGILEDLQRIEAAGARMLSLIDELLDISRLQTQRALELMPRATDLVGLATNVVAHYQETTSRHEVRLETAADRLIGSWDTARLERAVDNLVGNAVKFSPQGGEVTVAVNREAGDDRAWAVLTVHDEGIGIPEDEIERVFGRYERGGNAMARGISGTGIGLAYVREVAEAHGGRVEVQSKEGVGSTFTLRLPLPNGENSQVAESGRPSNARV